jgi:hypothetical protein
MDFKIKRDDGRSNSQVLLDYVQGKPPGTVFLYEELQDVFSSGTNKKYTKNEAQRIVTESCPRMLKEQNRTLHNMRNVGYRIAHAAQHVVLASYRKERGEKQFLRSEQVLIHVHLNEMTQNERREHQGQLIMMIAMRQQLTALERRQSAIENAINRVMRGAR